MSSKPKFLTFNDGFVKIHPLSISALGNEEEPKLKLPFEHLTIGAKRNFEAARADIKIDALIRTPMHRDVCTTDICCINNVWYKIAQVQHDTETKPPTSKLSLTALHGEICNVVLMSSGYAVDDIGQMIPTGSEMAEVVCLAESVTRTEWASAQQHGYQADWMLDVATSDYSGESIAELHGKRYCIYRTSCQGPRTNLYLGIRIGDLNGDFA